MPFWIRYRFRGRFCGDWNRNHNRGTLDTFNAMYMPYLISGGPFVYDASYRIPHTPVSTP